MTTLTALARQSLAGLRLLVAATLVLGLAYPLVVTAAAAAAWPWQAQGSLLDAAGERTTGSDDAVASALVGQRLDDPRLFVPRPSAAGEGYDPLASAGTNLGPESPVLLASVRAAQRAVAAREGVDVADVPADAVTSSASGLDPHVSPAYAALQVPRVARETGLSEGQVAALVAEHTQDRTLGVLGEPRVAVVPLDLAVLEAADGADR